MVLDALIVRPSVCYFKLNDSKFLLFGLQIITIIKQLVDFYECIFPVMQMDSCV